MHILHLVSHTHWDREWYLAFQVFRLKLVQLMDSLLELLADDPAYLHYMLDGQTIILEDYLLMRPEREEEIRAHVQNGRLLIGPWHVLPDEFLVSPEALVRNLLQGQRTARRFGPIMRVGYIPDPFGHIGQMPQILRSFGITAAALRRGLADEPCELFWKAPDGSTVLLAYLRDGYDNAASLPMEGPNSMEPCLTAIRRLHDSLAPHSATGQILLMHGTDHMPPQPHTSAALNYVRGRLGDNKLTHSTLPAYLEAVEAAIDEQQMDVPIVVGELRNPKRHHLLSGVLSTRMWIKQRNHTCETLLEKWAEPFSSWADQLKPPAGSKPGGLAPILRQAWHLLMECHPHDSICGCSIDQVHKEMRSRFDQVEQIGEEITAQSLSRIATAVDTTPPAKVGDCAKAVLVFNPGAGPRTDLVTVPCETLPGTKGIWVVDATGQVLPSRVVEATSREIDRQSLGRAGLPALLHSVRDGWVSGQPVLDVDLQRDETTLRIKVILGEASVPNMDVLSCAAQRIMTEIQDPALNQFIVQTNSHLAIIEFLARDVPGYGYRTFWIKPAPPPQHRGKEKDIMQNEYLLVTADSTDGTLTVTDKRSGARFTGLNRFVDRGDCGDEYNYCPPPVDTVVEATAQAPPQIHLQDEGTCQCLEIAYVMSVPAKLSSDRKGRSVDLVPLYIRTVARLIPGVPRVDIITEVNNTARDHRLCVHFPTDLTATTSDHDGHFHVLRRPIDLPSYDDTWVEQPCPEVPQRAFTDVSDGIVGLMIASRGLPEVAVLRNEDGTAVISLTLLRCVGWLSRADLATRRGHAGPARSTPGAQMDGRYRFEYALIPHQGGWERAYLEAYAFNAPMRASISPICPGLLPPTEAFLQVEPASFVLSAVKIAENGAGLIVRGYNIEAEPIQVTLTPWTQFAWAARVRLDEEEIEQLTIAEDGTVHLTVRGHEIVTIRLQ